jgi:prolyl oligopeptidase
MFHDRACFLFASVLVSAVSMLLPSGAAAQLANAPPKAREAPVEDQYFGTKVVDPYRWMETPESAELKEWLKGQASHTVAVLERIPGRKNLLTRIHALDQSVSDVFGIVQAGPRFFYFRADPSKPVPQIMVRDGLDGAEKLLFDPATLSQAAGHAEAGWFAPSRDGRYLAVGISFGGAEEAGHLRVVDVDRAQLLDEDLPRVWGGDLGGSPVWFWLPDNRTFAYFQFPQLAPGQSPQERMLRSRTFLHILGSNANGNGDRPIFGFGVDPAIEVAKENTNYVLIPPTSEYAIALTSTVDVDFAGVFVAPLAELSAEHVHWTRVAGPGDQIQSISNQEVHGQDLYLVSRKDTARFHVLRVDLAHPDVSHAQVVVPPSESVVENIGAAADGLYILDLDGGLSRLRRLRWGESQAQPVSLPFVGAIRAVYTHPSFPGALLRMRSRTHPNVILRVDGRTGTSRDTGWQEAPKVDFSDIDEREVTAVGHDGTRIPLSILIRKDARLDGSRPTLLDSYGAYGVFGTAKPFFDPMLLAWLERGGVLAVAHPRGGGEFGEDWHRAGMQQTKLNTVFDTIACAQYLIDHHYTNPRRLALQGASAGGLVVGGAIAWRPELFAAAIDHDGVSDALRAETEANGPVNIPEFGSTHTEAGFHALYAMSPYHHLRDGIAYPAVFLETGANDPRVDAWQMAKMTARLQAASSSGRPVLLRVDFDTGHFGGTTAQTEQLLADEWSFLLWQFNEPEFQPRGSVEGVHPKRGR